MFYFLSLDGGSQMFILLLHFISSYHIECLYPISLYHKEVHIIFNKMLVPEQRKESRKVLEIKVKDLGVPG